VEDEGVRLVRALQDDLDDGALQEALVAWLARRLDVSSDLAELSSSLLGELPGAARARVLDAAAARAGVAFGAAALACNPWVPSECWALGQDGASLLSSSSSSAILLHGEDLAERLDLELPDPEAFILGPRAAAVEDAGLVIARMLRRSREEDGEPREDFLLRFDRYDRARQGWAMSLTHPNLQTEEVWIAPGLAHGVAADRGELIAFDLRLHEETPGSVHRRPTPHADVYPAGFLAPDRFLLSEDQGFFPSGASRAVVWDPTTGEDVYVGPWQEAWTFLAAAPGSPWVLAWGILQGGMVTAWVLPAEDLDGPLPRSLRVPQLRSGRVSPDGRFLVGRGEQCWVVDREDSGRSTSFRLGRNLPVQDANDVGLVLVGWNQPQVLSLASRRPLRARSAPSSEGSGLHIDDDQVVLATRGDGVQRRWDRATGASQAVFTDTPLAVPGVVVHLAEQAEAPTAVEVLDAATGDILRRFRPEVEEGALAGIATGLSPVDLVGVTRGGRVVIAYRVLGGGLVTAFDLEAGEVLWHAAGHPVDDPLTGDGGMVLLGEQERRQFPFRKIDLRTGETLAELLLPRLGSTIPRMAVDPSTGDCWLFHTRAVVRVAPGETAAEEVELPGTTRALAFDAEGRGRARSIDPYILVLEDRATGEELRRWETEAWVEPALCFHEGALFGVVGGVVRRFELP
jgi:hypothetical protein